MIEIGRHDTALMAASGRRHTAFGMYCLCVAAANFRLLMALVHHSIGDASASHLIVIPLAALALVYRRRTTVFSTVQSDIPAGIGLILGGLGLLVTAGGVRASAGQASSLTWPIAAIVVLWAGGFLLFYGRQAARAALFPLLFLGLMIPIPPQVLDGAIVVLKSGSTEVVAALFALTGTPFYREGFVFSLPSVVIEIADECSGIRSSIALLLTSLLAGDLYLKSPWRRAILVLAILPVTLIKNGVRIVGLSLLAMHVDPSFLTGQLHKEGGIVFFVLALALLGPVLVFLHKSEASKPSAPEAARVLV
jgi:exosortase